VVCLCVCTCVGMYVCVCVCLAECDLEASKKGGLYPSWTLVPLA